MTEECPSPAAAHVSTTTTNCTETYVAELENSPLATKDLSLASKSDHSRSSPPVICHEKPQSTIINPIIESFLHRTERPRAEDGRAAGGARAARKVQLGHRVAAAAECAGAACRGHATAAEAVGQRLLHGGQDLQHRPAQGQALVAFRDPFRAVFSAFGGCERPAFLAVSTAAGAAQWLRDAGDVAGAQRVQLHRGGAVRHAAPAARGGNRATASSRGPNASSGALSKAFWGAE